MATHETGKLVGTGEMALHLLKIFKETRGEGSLLTKKHVLQQEI